MTTESLNKLAALKAAFGDQERETNRESFTNSYYPFWLMENGQKAVIRFLPDAFVDNPRGFLVEKPFHNLMINGQKKTVACLSLYEEDCPICKLSQDYYKAKDEINGKKYWRKKQYIAQALIIEDPLPPNEQTGETHQGQVRYIALGYQIYNIIKEAFASEDEPLETIPYNFNDGYDFVIKKTEQGKYSTYTVGTKFYSRPRSLTEEELSIVSDNMVDLSTLLPKNPGIEKVQAMLNADLNGEEFHDTGTAGEDFEQVPEIKPTPTGTKPPKSVEVEQDSSESEGSSEVDRMLAEIQNRHRNQSK